MNRRNYAKELNRIIENHNGNKPRLLLHCCCGPCSTSVLEYLADCFDVTALWYNPNIFPEEEFKLRLSTFYEVINKLGLENQVRVLPEPWSHEEYSMEVAGLEKEKEGGKRCAKCFELRLKRTAEIAKEKGFDYFCTTLTVSRHKNAVLINDIGEKIGRAIGIQWLPSDFKKNNGENRSVELSEQFEIYRQLYCGCEYSLAARQVFEK